MNKWVILYLLFNVVAFAMPTGYTISLFKLGGLISHFQDHKHALDKISFFSFLASHYLEKKHHQDEHSDHEKLPFHDHHNEGVNFASQTPSLQPIFPSTLVTPKLIIQSDIEIAEISTFPSSAFHGDIWQPPKA